MSNSTQQDGIDTSALELGQIALYLDIAATALYCYEWLVTLDQEVKYIWAKRWTLSTWIFAVNRYASLIYAVGLLLPTPTFDSCRSVLLLWETIILVQFIPAALFSGIRVFALSGRNFWLFLLVFVLGMVPFATNMFQFTTDTIELTDEGCMAVLNMSDKVHSGLSFSTRGCIILADVIVLVVTWVKTIGTVREASRLNVKVPLSEILIRDGTLFFTILLVVNVLVLVANAFPTTAAGLFIFGSSFLESTPPIIISRFFLNLRQANRTSVDHQESMTAPRSTIRFHPDILVGNMGESLRFGPEDDHPGRRGSEDGVERSGIHWQLGEPNVFPAAGSDHDTEDIEVEARMP